MMLRDNTVYVTISSLRTHHPTFHRTNGRYNMMMGLAMKCDPKHLYEFDCYPIPIRHAVKFARPCLNCFREKR